MGSPHPPGERHVAARTPARPPRPSRRRPSRPPSVAAKAQAVLAAHCSSCHAGGKAKGGFGYTLDRERLVARGKVVPGKPADSELYERVRGGEMPPAWAKGRVGEADLATLKQWIEAGAPDWQTAAPRSFVSDDAVLRLALDDVQSLPSASGASCATSPSPTWPTPAFPTRSCVPTATRWPSWSTACRGTRALTAPEPIDAGRTVFRLDLRDYKWNARSWDRLVAAYPYRPAGETPDGRAWRPRRGRSCRSLRGDWFVATASRPPLYHDLLRPAGAPTRGWSDWPASIVLTDVQEESAARAGFNGSGVSRNNRLIERHDASYGAYWRSYDFADNTGRRNLFDHPLGPAAGGGSFAPDGGEIIFNLPNGLQGYMLVDGSGRRIDRAPSRSSATPSGPTASSRTASRA